MNYFSLGDEKSKFFFLEKMRKVILTDQEKEISRWNTQGPAEV